MKALAQSIIRERKTESVILLFNFQRWDNEEFVDFLSHRIIP